MENLENSDELFKILGIENLDLDYLKDACYSMIEESTILSNNYKDKNDIDTDQLDKFLKSVKETNDLSKVLHQYIFAKWILTTKKLKVENTPELKEQTELLYKIHKMLNNPKKVEEYLRKANKFSGKGKVSKVLRLNSDDYTKKEKNEVEYIQDSEIPEWDLSRYAHKGDELDYNLRFGMSINPKTNLILNSRKDNVAAFLVGKFAVKSNTEEQESKIRTYKMLAVFKDDIVYMLIGKFDLNDIKENPEFYIKNMFNDWSLKNAYKNNFGFPGRVVLDENGDRMIDYDIPGCKDLVEALSIARKEYPEVFGLLKIKYKDSQDMPKKPSEEEGR